MHTITSVPQVIDALTQLDADLPKTTLANLKVFNHTYLIITRNIYKKIQNNSFVDKEEMIQLIVNFAHFYFNAIKNYQNGNTITKAWEIAFDVSKTKKTHQLLYLALAANAHINNDLPFSLQEIVKGKDHARDYQEVEKIITESIEEILHGVSKSFYIDTYLSGLYEFIIKILINNWRKSAWNNYIKLQAKEITEKDIQDKAASKAGKIKKLTNIL